MTLFKKTKDNLIKSFWGNRIVPRGLYELDQYFRLYDPIHFKYEKNDNTIIGINTNFKYGSIITSGKNEKELDKNIKDAILTSFDIPSSYAKEAKIYKVGDKQKTYALA